MSAPPPWLEALQTEFSALLRSPLDSTSGTFRETRTEYPPQLIEQLATRGAVAASREDRLALYHTQYWMRLFTVLQDCFPRVAHSVGYFHFNRLASLHLSERPPNHFDVARAGDGFAQRLRLALADKHPPLEELKLWHETVRASGVPAQLALQALQLDEAEQRALDAPQPSIWTPSVDEYATLSERRLRFSAGFSVVQEDWDLVRHSALAQAEAPSGAGSQRPDSNARPEPLPQRRYWVFYRSAKGVAFLPVRAELASLLVSCRQMSLGSALELAEAKATERQLATLRSNLESWVRLALKTGWWIGFH